MHTVKFRSHQAGAPPRRTKLEIPGWAGDRRPRANGSEEQMWHCLPFSEGAQYGIEVFYPHDHELRVTRREGKLYFEGDFGPPPESGLMWPPFRNFGERFYTYQLLIDIDAGPGWAIRTEPHPRFYSDTSGTVPIAVPALIRHWWPMVSFLVFKSPNEGQTHIFRQGEPFVQILVIPENADFELQGMSEEEDADRELRSRRIHAARKTLAAETQWTSSANIVFDGTYRHMLRAAKDAASDPIMRLAILNNSDDDTSSDGGDGGGGSNGGDGDDGGGGDTAPSSRRRPARPQGWD